MLYVLCNKSLPGSMGKIIICTISQKNPIRNFTEKKTNMAHSLYVTRAVPFLPLYSLWSPNKNHKQNYASHANCFFAYSLGSWLPYISTDVASSRSAMFSAAFTPNGKSVKFRKQPEAAICTVVFLSPWLFHSTPPPVSPQVNLCHVFIYSIFLSQTSSIIRFKLGNAKQTRLGKQTRHFKFAIEF